MTTIPQLISIPVSPWSERTKFALHVAGFTAKVEGSAVPPSNDDHTKQIEVVDYVAMIHEPYLRYVLGVWNPL